MKPIVSLFLSLLVALAALLAGLAFGLIAAVAAVLLAVGGCVCWLSCRLLPLSLNSVFRCVELLIGKC
jgi:hypothetical protein